MSRKHLIYAFYIFPNKRDAFDNLRSILINKVLSVGSDNMYLLSSIREWTICRSSYNGNALVDRQSGVEYSWAIGFRLDMLKELVPGSKWVTYNTDRDLPLFLLPPNSEIDFKHIDESRDVVVLCPSNKECDQYFRRGYNKSDSSKLYPYWYWMNISKESILNHKTDDDLRDFLVQKFDTRNRLLSDPLLEINSLF